MKYFNLICLFAFVAASCGEPVEEPIPVTCIGPQDPTAESWEFTPLAKVNSNSDYDLSFANENIGYLAQDPLILKTEDGGQTFQEVFRQDNCFPKLLSVPAPDTVYAITFKNYYYIDCPENEVGLYKSTNGGAAWELIELPFMENVTDLDFVDGQTGFLLNNNPGSATFELYKTIDGGLTWHKVENLEPNYTPALFFEDKDTGFVTGINQIFYRTTDGGVNWESVASNFYYVTSMKFLDSKVGFAVQNDGLYKTTDGGLVWKKNLNHPPVMFHFSDESNGIAFRYDDTCTDANGHTTSYLRFHYTQDGGAYWEPSEKVIAPYFDLDFPTPTTGYFLLDNQLYRAKLKN